MRIGKSDNGSAIILSRNTAAVERKLKEAIKKDDRYKARKYSYHYKILNIKADAEQGVHRPEYY